MVQKPQVLKRSKTPERPEGVWAAAVYGGGHPAQPCRHGDGIMDDLKSDHGKKIRLTLP